MEMDFYEGFHEQNASERCCKSVWKTPTTVHAEGSDRFLFDLLAHSCKTANSLD